MKSLHSRYGKMVTAFTALVFVLSSCEKNDPLDHHFDIDVILHGGKSVGYLKFRQDPDPAKVVDLDIKVANLLPGHEYLLQRAVDPINVVDGNCTSTTWLTLGKGLTAQSILTDKFGNGQEHLWRDVSTVATGSKFDIHFQVIDAANMAVVLISDCYDYEVR
jgi:hypothetical protein